MNAEETGSRATVGGGCFWCVEAVYQTVPGILRVTSGYAGGSVANPTYEQVCTGRTGHAEVVQVEFDPAKISYRQVIDLFWQAHDPTTPNRQGADVGPQYRSIILYENEAEKTAAAVRARQDGYLADCDRVTRENVERYGIALRLWQNLLATLSPML